MRELGSALSHCLRHNSASTLKQGIESVPVSVFRLGTSDLDRYLEHERNKELC
jgi:hypothetical protein